MTANIDKQSNPDLVAKIHILKEVHYENQK